MIKQWFREQNEKAYLRNIRELRRINKLWMKEYPNEYSQLTFRNRLQFSKNILDIRKAKIQQLRYLLLILIGLAALTVKLFI